MRLISRKLLLLCACVALVSTLLSAQARPQDVAGQTSATVAELSPDLQEVRLSAEAFVKAFNQQDAASVAGLWTQEGEYIDETGFVLQGREQIEEAYQAFFEKNPKASIRIAIDSLRMVGGHTAIEDGRTLVEVGDDAAPSVNRYTAVHEKVDGKWLMASIRESSQLDATGRQSIRDLEFLIGTWTAEEFGNRSESVCQWVAGESFVERKYTTTFRDGSQTTGVQLIGWNPSSGCVQSWDFGPGGGHAVGIWTPADDGWTSEIQGYNAGGTPISSVNLLRRLDDNAYAWQSIERRVGDMVLPDTHEVILKRKSAN